MIVKCQADFMVKDPDRTKLKFFLLDHHDDEEGRHLGYLSMPNEVADAFLAHGMLLNTGEAAEHGETESDEGGHTFILADKRGRRDHG